MLRNKFAAALLTIGCLFGCSSPAEDAASKSDDAFSAGDGIFAATWAAAPGGTVGDNYRTFPLRDGRTILFARTNGTDNAEAEGGGGITWFDAAGRVQISVPFTTQFIPIHAYVDGAGDVVFTGTPSLAISPQVPTAARMQVEVIPGVKVMRECVGTILGKMNQSGKIVWIRSIESSYDGPTGHHCDAVSEPRVMPLPNGEVGLLTAHVHSGTGDSNAVLRGFDGDRASPILELDDVAGLYRFGTDGSYKTRINWTGTRTLFAPLTALGGVLGAANVTRPDGTRVFSITRTLPTGLVYWKREIPAPNFTVNAMKADAGGNFYVAGTFVQSGFGIDGQALQPPSDEGSDGFVGKFDALGRLVFLRSLWGHGEQKPVSLSVDASGVTHVWGTYTVEAVVGNKLLLQAGGKRHMFLAGIDGTGQWKYSNSFGDPNSNDGAAWVEAGPDGVVVTGGADFPFSFGRATATQPPYGYPILTMSPPASNVLVALPAPNSRRPGFQFIAKLRAQ